LGRKAAAQGKQIDPIADNAQTMLDQGRKIFRFDTFGDEAFWGDTIKLHQALAGDKPRILAHVLGSDCLPSS
jgi:hypothetical protein